MSNTDIILGTMLKMPPIFDLFIITAKMHIYACKFYNTIPKVEGFIKRIENIRNIEKYIPTKNNKTNLFNQKWLITDQNTQ